MAVKIIRQPKKIALIGAPSSAAGFIPGMEKSPAALRNAGLVERLQAAGFEVTDYGDCAPRLFADDEEHRRARNLSEIVAGLTDLRARAEIAAKTGALVLVLGGDCAQAIGLLAGMRRYHKHVNLLWMDRDADLNTPASTPSGRIDGMVVAHIIGKGAPELVRFWGEPPLVREPDVLLFGLERLDPPEQEFLARSPMRHVYAADVQFKGGAVTAQEALVHLHADGREFVLHLDLDLIAEEEFPAVGVPGSGGVNFAEARAALIEIVRHKNLLGLDVAQYNPEKDPDGSWAKKIVDLLAEALAARLETLTAPPPAEAPAESAVTPAGEAVANEAAAAEASASEAPTTETPTTETPETETSTAEAPASDPAE